MAYESVDATGQVSALSYAQLASRVSVLAEGLCAGDDAPVLLAYPAGLDVGLDSVRAAEAAAVVEDAVGLTVPLADVLVAPTPRAVAEALVARWLTEGSSAELVRSRVARVGVV